MNYTLNLCQPVMFWNNKKHSRIKPNLHKMPILLGEVEYNATEVVPILELSSWLPFTHLLKAVDYETDKFSVIGYYLTGKFTLDGLKQAIEEGHIRKAYNHCAFSDIPVEDRWEVVAVSYDDTRVLIDNNGTLGFVER